MASFIAVPRDLTKVKSKVAFNLTKRQLICFSLAALIGVPLFFLLKRTGSVSAAAMGMMVVMMPLFFFGMYEKNGEPLEVILAHFIRANFIRPKIRIYETNNDYAALARHAAAEREVRAIVERYQRPVSEEREKKAPDSGVRKGWGPEENGGDRADGPPG